MNSSGLINTPNSKIKKICLLLFMSVFSFQLLFASGHLYSFDEVVIFETARNLIDRGDISIEHTPARREYTKPGKTGKLYSKFGIGMSTYLVPIYGISKLCGIMIGVSNPLKFAEIISSFANILVISFTAVIFFLTLLEFNSSVNTAFICTSLLVFSSPLAVYGRSLFNDALTGLALLISFRAFRKEDYLLASLAAGLAFSTRAEYALIVPVYAVAAGKKFHKFLIPALVCAVILSVFNYARFGSPFEQGTLTEHPTDRFDTPLHIGLIGNLFSPGKGLIWFAPILILSVFGIKKMFDKHKKELLLILGIFIPLLILHSLWHSWMGGWSYGPRRIVALLPLIIIPAFLKIEEYSLKRKGILAIILLGLTGFFVQFGGLTTNFMKYLAAANKHQIPVIWSLEYFPIAGQLNSFINGERDLWYYILFGKTLTADIICASLVILTLILLNGVRHEVKEVT